MRHRNIAVFVPHLGCPHRCVFCDQRTITGEAHIPTPAELSAVCERAAKDGYAAEESEFAFFGGSFTAIEREAMLRCLGAVQPYRGTVFKGIRISTRPDATDEETLRLLKTMGVTAVELGAQSMDDRVLAMNGRGHTAADTAAAVRRLRAYGFSVGLQMMTGLYGSTPETDLGTAAAFAALAPDTVRIYPTLVLRSTALAALYESGRYTPQTLEESVAQCASLLALFHGRGIRVIRLGLHAGEALEKNLLAGPFHPAFRELCEARLYRDALDALFAGAPKGAYTVCVAPGHVSRAAGQKKENRQYFYNKGYNILKITEAAGTEPFRPAARLEKETTACI